MTSSPALTCITEKVIAAAIEVHRALGPGLLESAYQTCLAFELTSLGVAVETQKTIPLQYRGITIDCGYRLDLLVEGSVIVEVKSVERLHRVHSVQLLSYLRLTGCTVGLLINFNEQLLKHGLRRIVNGCDEDIKGLEPIPAPRPPRPPR